MLSYPMNDDEVIVTQDGLTRVDSLGSIVRAIRRDFYLAGWVFKRAPCWSTLPTEIRDCIFSYLQPAYNVTQRMRHGRFSWRWIICRLVFDPRGVSDVNIVDVSFSSVIAVRLDTSDPKITLLAPLLYRHGLHNERGVVAMPLWSSGYNELTARLMEYLRAVVVTK